MKKKCIAFAFILMMTVSTVKAAEDCIPKLNNCRDQAINIEQRAAADSNAYQKCEDLCTEAKLACKANQDNLNSASAHHLYCKSKLSKMTIRPEVSRR